MNPIVNVKVLDGAPLRSANERAHGCPSSISTLGAVRLPPGPGRES